MTEISYAVFVFTKDGEFFLDGDRIVASDPAQAVIQQWKNFIGTGDESGIALVTEEGLGVWVFRDNVSRIEAVEAHRVHINDDGAFDIAPVE